MHRVEIYRKIMAGLEPVAKHQRALERAGSYPNLNRRRPVSGPSLSHSVNRLVEYRRPYIAVIVLKCSLGQNKCPTRECPLSDYIMAHLVKMGNLKIITPGEDYILQSR